MSRNKRVKPLSPAAAERQEVKSGLRQSQAAGRGYMANAADFVCVSARVDSLALATGVMLRAQKWLLSPKERAKLEAEGRAYLKSIGALKCDTATELLVRISLAVEASLAPPLVRAGLKRTRTAGGVLEFRGQADFDSIRAIVEPHHGQVHKLPPVTSAESVSEGDQSQASSTASDEPASSTPPDTEPSERAEASEPYESLTDRLERAPAEHLSRGETGRLIGLGLTS